MPGELTMSLSSETLASGSAEERATFGLFSMTANDRPLTAGEDTERRELRHGPHVSGYPLAEWLAWNWWRIRWEFARPFDGDAARRWDFAHRMSTVGDGYAWPDITIFSDGLHAFLDSGPSRNPDTVLFRYLGTPGRQTVPATILEAAIDGFVEDILARLEDRGLRDTNLHRLRHDLRAERERPEVARFRRLEAQLGRDPDEADAGAIRRRLADAAKLGEEALREVAADAAFYGHAPSGMMSAEDIVGVARRSGFDADPADAVALGDAADVPRPEEAEAWRVGEGLARGLRAEEHLDGQPIPNERLAGFAGTTRDAIPGRHRRSHGMSFALDGEGGRARVALRSKWETGRRFELARLVGDRLLAGRIGRSAERLFPATRAYSYRQKVQRAFAAELLSPMASVDDMLGGDYSEDGQNDAAERFKVSPMTIRTQLVNHRRIDREDAPDIAGRGTMA